MEGACLLLPPIWRECVKEDTKRVSFVRHVITFLRVESGVLLKSLITGLVYCVGFGDFILSCKDKFNDRLCRWL